MFITPGFGGIFGINIGTYCTFCAANIKSLALLCLQGIWKSGISIFASQLHTHLTGKQVYTKHYRAGAELPELNRDNHYSPHYQEIRKLQRPVKILPVSVTVVIRKLQRPVKILPVSVIVV